MLGQDQAIRRINAGLCGGEVDCQGCVYMC